MQNGEFSNTVFSIFVSVKTLRIVKLLCVSTLGKMSEGGTFPDQGMFHHEEHIAHAICSSFRGCFFFFFLYVKSSPNGQKMPEANLPKVGRHGLKMGQKEFDCLCFCAFHNYTCSVLQTILKASGACKYWPASGLVFEWP